MSLTEKYKKQLEAARSKLNRTKPKGPAVGGNLWDRLGKEDFDDDYGMAADALLGVPRFAGAALWNFADTWTFGAAGLADDKLLGGILEDTLYEEESIWAKWGGAVGGLAGFIGPRMAIAPLKIGLGAAKMMARPVARTVGLSKKTKFLDDVVESMSKQGTAAGLTKEQAAQVAQQYKNLHAKSQFTDDILNNWSKHSSRLMDDILERGLGTGKLNSKEAAAVKQMFENNMGKRPINDLVDVVMQKGKFKSAKTGWWVGNAFQEALAFGLIDSVFEVTRSVKEDRAFDWTAPIWGAGIGTGFGALRMLPSAGKASITSNDLSAGVKAAFDKRFTNFRNVKGDDLINRARGHGEMLKKYGKGAFVNIDDTFRKVTKKGETLPWVVKVKYRGTRDRKNEWLDLNDIHNLRRYRKDISKKDLELMTQEALRKSTRDLGGQLINQALRDEAGSMARNWHRMIGGAIIMNARTWYDMYKGADPDLNDVLPHVFIGAWINRRGNPTAWDMNHQRMNSIRENLHFLGISSANLHTIPDLTPPPPSYLHGMKNNPRMEPVISKMREYEHLTDDVDEIFTIKTAKEQGELSVKMDDSTEARIYKAIHQHSAGVNKHQRTFDDIPIGEAKEIVKLFKKAAKDDGFEIKRSRDAYEYLDDMAHKSSEILKDEFITIVEDIATSTQKFTLDPAGNTRRNQQLPDILPSEKLMIEATKDPSIASQSTDMIHDTFKKAQIIFDHVRNSGEVAREGERPQQYVERMETYQKIKDAVDKFEKKMSVDLPKGQEFDIIDSAPHIRASLVYNFARKAMDDTGNFFDKLKNPLFDKLKESLNGITFGASDDLLKQKLVPDASNKHILIEDAPNKEAEDNSRRFLGGIIEVLGAKGQHTLLSSKKKIPGEKGYEPYFKIPYSRISSLKEFLRSNNVLISDNLPFHSEIVHSILRDRIKGSTLTSADVTGLTSVINLGYGNFFTPGFGKASGWSMSEVDPIRYKSGMIKRLAKSVNKRLNDISKASITYDNKGKELGRLVKILKGKERKIIPDEVDLKAMHHLLTHGIRNYDGKILLSNMLNLVNPALGGSRELLYRYTSSGGAGNSGKVMAWLEDLGILTRNKKNQLVPSDNHRELLTQSDIIKKLTDRVEVDSGSSLADIQARIDEIGQQVESSMSGFEDVSKPMRMSMSKFFDTYNVEDGPGNDYKDQLDYINSMLFKDGKEIVDGGIKSLIDNIYINYNGKETLVKNIPDEASRQSRYQDILPEVINLILTRVQSRDYGLLAYEDGSFREDTAHMTRNPRFDDLQDNKMTPVLLTGDISKLIPSAFGSGTARKYLNIFEAFAGNLSDNMTGPLKNHYRNFVELLDRPTTFFEGSEMQLKTKGLIMFDIAPDATKFALAKEDLPSLSDAYINFVNKLDVAIKDGDISLDPNKWKILSELKHSMLGGKLKPGDQVKWVLEGEGRSQLTSKTFIVRDINPNDPSKIRLRLDTDIETSVKTNKELSELLMDAVSNGLDRRVLQPINGNKTPTNDDYQMAMRHWSIYKWKVGDTNDWSTFERAYQLTDPSKELSRIRLYETKNFNRENRGIFKGIDLTKRQQKLFDKYEDGSNVMIFDDVSNYDVRNYMEDQFKNFGLRWDEVLGDRSSDSLYDSISFVSKDEMMYQSFIHGFKNWRTNSILKPVISSNKDTFLMGKTIFVYDPYLDGYFDKHNIDILMSGSAAKLKGKDWEVNSEPLNTDVPEVGPVLSLDRYIKKIQGSSIGIKPENFEESNLAKRSLSNYNYMDNTETKNIYDRDFKQPLKDAMEGIVETLQSPIHVNQFIKKSYKDEDSAQAMIGNENRGTSTLGELRLYNEISDRANVMDMNPRVVFNKLYNYYLNPIINGKSIFWGEQGYVAKSDGRYGGKSVLIQSLDPQWRNLKGTIVNKKGEVLQIGEMVLSHNDSLAKLNDLMNQGYELTFIDNKNAKVLNMDEVLGGKEFWKELAKDGYELGDIKNFLDEIRAGDADNDFSVGIMVNRYPRTRPNDVTYLALKGFLDERMGNATIVNPYDVLNVFEGDYDADKADYYFMQNRTMSDHVAKNISQNWIQSVEPQDSENINGEIPLAKFDSSRENKMFRIATSNSLVNSKARGIGQTMPRLLNHVRHISQEITPKMIKGDSGLLQMQAEGNELVGKHLVLRTDREGQREYIILDFDSNNVHHRLALAAQTQLDLSNKVSNMYDDVLEWKRDTFFGEKDLDIEKYSEFDQFKPGFESDKITSGDVNRPKIFKKFTFDGERINEVKLDTLDQEMLMQVMDNHSKFLQLIPGIFEKSGERRKASYEDIWERSNDYFNFYQDIGSSLYHRLKNNRNINDDRIARDKLNAVFGVDRAFRRGSKFYGKSQKQRKKLGKPTSKDYYYYNTTSPFDKMDPTLYKSIHEGTSGHVVDRIFNKIWSKNIFGDKEIPLKLFGKERALMDNHLDTFLGDLRKDGMTVKKREEAIGQYVENVIGTVKDINRSIGMLKKLKRDARRVRNKKITEKFTEEKRNDVLKGIQESIITIENNYGSFFDKNYKKTKRIKDLGEGVKYIPLNKNADIREGAIQHYTMRALGGIDWSRHYGKKYEAMNEYISNLKALERAYTADWYGNTDGSKTTFVHSPDLTLLNKSQRDYLKTFPSRATFEEIRTEIINRGIQRFDYPFLYKYAMPALNNKRVGVFQGVPLPVPYRSSSRIKVMLRYLARKAADQEDKGANHAKATLHRYAFISDKYRNLLEDNTLLQMSDTRAYESVREMMNFARETMQSDVGFVNHQIPSFHRDFTNAYNRYASLKFDINRSGFSDPILIVNDNVINFYRDIFRASGYEKDFKELINRISPITALQLDSRMVDPMTYLATMNYIEGDIVPKINDILSESNFDTLKQSVEIDRLRENPLWSVLGGSKHIIGKKMSFNPINRLSSEELGAVTKLIRQGRDIKEMAEENLKMDEWNRYIKCAEGDIRE